MTDSSSSSSASASPDRRSFLKIGVGVAGGLIVGGAVGYLAKGSSTTTSTETMSGTNTTSTETMSVTGPTTTTTTTATTTVSGPTTTSTVTGPTQTATTTATVTGPTTTETQTATTTVTSTTSNTSSIAALQNELTGYSGIADGLITVGVQEAAVITALAGTIIPEDSNGPGAVQAGVIYFIDRQLWGEYGTNGRMYNSGPFIMPNTPGPLTVNSLSGTPITYTGGVPTYAWTTSFPYQYGMNLRNFWRYGIDALESYANTAYGANYESLSAADQVSCLSDLFNNKPTAESFNWIIPSDFANEVFFMVWSGFLMDPMYGGNRGLVGWTLTASPGLNSGNFYGEGQTPQERMVSPVPLLLAPVSNAQFQQNLQISGVLSP